MLAFTSWVRAVVWGLVVAVAGGMLWAAWNATGGLYRVTLVLITVLVLVAAAYVDQRVGARTVVELLGDREEELYARILARL